MCIVSDNDFVEEPEVLTFPPFMTTVTPSLGNLDNDVNELTEYFSAKLTSLTNGLSVGTDCSAAVKIIDDDGKQLCSIIKDSNNVFLFVRYQSLANKMH